MSGHRMSLADLAHKGHVRDLFETIVQPGVCSGCGACVLACPVDALAYEIDKPVLLDRCIDCVLCSSACPRLNPTDGALHAGSPPSQSAIGSHLRIVGARSAANHIRDVGQDGGTVTALLTWAFERGLIDGVVTSQRSAPHPWQPRPVLVTTSAALLSCAGSAYTYSPNTLALKEAVDRGLAKVAFVGTGCEISALRQLQFAKSKKLRALAVPVALAIGLLCSETFEYEPFIHEQIERGLGVDLGDVAKINIKGRVLVYLRSGEVRAIPLKVVRPYARPGCQHCQDFGAECADISAGGLGLEGWTVVTLRTAAGEQFFDAAATAGAVETQPAEAFPAALDLYARLAAKQRERPSRALRTE